MKPIEELLKNLGRPEVLEFGLVTNRLPSVNIGGKFEPVDDEAPSTDALLQMLVTMGGSRYVDSLSDKPVQWTTRLDGVGVIAVAAIMRKDVVQARFTVARRDAPAGRAEPYQSHTQAGVPPVQRKEGAAPPQVQRPAGQFTRTQVGPGPAPQPKVDAPAPAAPAAQPSKPAPQVSPHAVIQAKGKSSVPPPATTKGVGPSAPPTDEWDDDDEPTVQTLSPPVSPPGGAAPSKEPPAGEPRPKPARKPEDAPQASRDPRTERTAAESAPQLSVAPVAPVAKATPSVGPPPPAGQPQKIPSAPVLSPPVSPVAATKPEPRRINTPTSVDAVDVEITTSDRQKVAVHADADGNEKTAEFTPPAKPEGKVDSSVPSTAPSAAGHDKERPRGDGAFDSYLALAALERASDLHIVADRPVMLRIATDLLPRTQVASAAHVERMVREIVPSRLRETLEHDGAVDFALDQPQHGRFRVNVSRQRTGFKISMRVIPRDVPTFASLGLPEGVAAAASFHQGLVLVTGPTGHGKTTTLAAIVDSINGATKHHVLTVEDPVEFVHGRKTALMSQREVGTHAKSFAAALKASLREDPDVIVVGELRDPETVRMAVAASETGHLVIGTMNTPNAAKTVDRLIDLFPPSEQSQVRTSVAGALRLIIGQRLVPSVDRRSLHVAVELLPTSIALFTLIRDSRTFQIPSLQQRGKAMGVVRLDESLADLVRAGKVTLEVAKQFAESPADLENQARAPRK